MAAELTSLVDRELVRVLDLVLLRKHLDGSVEAAELDEADERTVGALRAFEADLAMLLAEEDVEAVGLALEPGSLAAILVYENTWAGPFAASIRRAGGQLVANGRIPTQALLAAIEADRETVKDGASDATGQSTCGSTGRDRRTGDPDRCGRRDCRRRQARSRPSRRSPRRPPGSPR